MRRRRVMRGLASTMADIETTLSDLGAKKTANLKVRHFNIYLLPLVCTSQKHPH